MNIGIVGGGIGGMVTALLLQKEGHQVTIFEKDSKLGGRLAYVERDGYKIDKGPTIILLPDMLKEILNESGIPEEELEMIQCNPLYQLHFQNGQIFTKYANMELQKKEIERLYPGNGEGFDRFMRAMKQNFEIGKPNFLDQAFLSKKDWLNPKTMGTLLKLRAFRSVSTQLKHYFSDVDLQTAYALQTIYIGGNPYTTPGIYSLVSYSEHEHGIYYLKGGYASLVQVVEKALVKANVKVQTNAEVTEIVLEGDLAKGIVVDGIEHPLDSVVLNGDFPVAQKLVGEKKKYEPSAGCLLLYMGIDGQYDERMLHQFYMSKDFSNTMKEVFKEKKLPEDPSYYVFHPSLVDETLAPKGKGVLYVLVPVPSGSELDWEKEKEAFSQRIIESMEHNGFPELSNRVNWLEIRTPKEAEAEGLFAGGSFGIAPTLLQSGPFRPQLQPFSYQNVFAVGASIHPGGGIPIVLQGAKLLADHIKTTNRVEKRKEVTFQHEQSVQSIPRM
ncbi:capsular biosynthesis protein CpsH [Bacillus coahuilensis m2-6]|uniref:phytoene desaturase family protein n=1 Tax=Bacillus coahuilensis TaxID=408580 RepID=UPI0001850BC9|nr:phytoene desaturase family protein [Bacillus coahuilensis]KUP09048.1 capsular biosynthesis protein CpsH [Bacillus coahuilensis m2-6]